MAWSASPVAVAVADHGRVVQAAKSIVQGAESFTRLTTVITISTTTTVEPEAAHPALARRPVTRTITIAVLVVTEAVAEAEAVREVGERPVNVVVSAAIADVDDRARQVARLVRVVTRALILSPRAMYGV
jgi:hypothetical protein